jgi:hypothetical protein
MSSEASEILAKALEADASAQESGQLDGIGMLYDEVLCEILPINDIPEPLFNLAFSFWGDWLDAKDHNWFHHEPLTSDDWPRIAKSIASHLRQGTLPEDQLILKLFQPASEPLTTSLFRRLSKWISSRA